MNVRSMKGLLLLPLLAAAALLGCRDKPAARPPPAPAAGAEIALFQIGQSEAAVQTAIAAVPNFRQPDGAGSAALRAGEKVSTLEAQATRPAADRPAAMRFRFEERHLIQAELTYRAADAAARGALYDRLLNGLAGGATHATNQVLDWGGRVAWLHVSNRLLVVHEARADARDVTVRMSAPVFR